MDYAMIVLPAAAYLDQARTIYTNKELATFNPDTCGVLILCNLFRVYYWMTAKFSTVFLYQSLVMISTQLMLQNLCVSITQPKNPSKRHISHYRSLHAFLKHFWRWTQIRHYLLFLLGLSITLTFLHFLLGKYVLYSEFLAVLALGIEASVPMPQAYSNYKRKSTMGVSWILILSWIGGDTFKIYYYLQTNAPTPFFVCGVVQVMVDILISFQIIQYMNNNMKKKKYYI